MTQEDVNTLLERYLSLESLEVTEELLDLCGATIDQRALPVLRRRLQEEEPRLLDLRARGYIRLGEKCEHLMTSTALLITALEEMKHDQ